MVAVDAVAVEARRELAGLLGHAAHRLDVGAGGGELLLVALGGHPDVVPEHVEGEPHLLRPRPQLARGQVVERHLQARVHLLAGEEHAVGLVVDDLDRLVVDAIDPVDEPEHGEGADGELKALLDGQHVLVVEVALAAHVGAEDGEPLLEDLDAGELAGGPRLLPQRHRAVLGERALALLLHVLAHEVLEHRVHGLAEAQRHAGLGLLLVDVVQLEAERALLEARQARVGQVLVLEARHGSPSAEVRVLPPG